MMTCGRFLSLSKITLCGMKKQAMMVNKPVWVQKEQEARQLCKERGFRVKRLLDWSDDEFLFLCARGKIVAVVNGRVIPAPGRKNLIQVMQIICKKPRVKGQARRG